VAAVLDKARALGVTPLVGAADSVEATTLYYAWRPAIRAAGALKMPYEEGLAHLEIGWWLAADHPERRVHLARACEIFAAVGARFDLARAGQLLPEAAPPIPLRFPVDEQPSRFSGRACPPGGPCAAEQAAPAARAAR
jgi:hypothetical protein